MLRFADFELDQGAYELRRGGQVVHLERIPLDLLFLLAERRGRLVGRDEILERVWGKGVFLDGDASINAAVRKIRRALGDDADAPRFVITVPAKGYRFIASACEESLATSAQPAAQPEEPRPTLAAPAGRLAWGHFIGRAEEMAALRAAIDASLGGQASLVMLVGEPGIGKTRLAEEAGAYARQRGAQVLVGHCYEGEAASPYSSFVEAIREHVSTRPDDALKAELGDGTSYVAKLVPEIRRRLPDLTPSPAAEPREERKVLFDSVASFLVNASKANPIMLLLEDLQWADQASLLLLHLLVRRSKGSRLMVVGTYRDVEVDRDHPLSSTLAELRRERLYERVFLGGLSESEVKDLIEAISQQKMGEGQGEAFVRAVLRETEGNPFFIEEVLRHLVESGGLYRREGCWVADPKSIAELRVPEGVRDVIGRRLSRLSEPTNRMLAAAAVLGREFEFELLAPMTGLSDDAMLQAIEEAYTNQMIMETRGRSGARYAFTHALVRQTLYEEFSLPRRQRAHLQAARAIELVHQHNLEPHVAALANHYRVAGAAADPEKTIDYLMRAGSAAYAVLAYEEAGAHLNAALELLETLPQRPERWQTELDLGLMKNLIATALYGMSSEERLRAVERMCEAVERLGDESSRFRALFSEADVHFAREEFSSGMELFRRCEQLAERSGSRKGLLLVHRVLAIGAWRSGDLLEASSRFDDLMKRLGPNDLPETEELVLINPWPAIPGSSASVQLDLGRPDEALRLSDEALRRARQLGQPLTLGSVLEQAALLRCKRREPEAALALAEETIALAQEHELREFSALGRTLRRWALRELNQAEQAFVESDAYAALAPSAWRGDVSGLVAQIHMRGGRAEQAIAVLDEMLARAERLGLGLHQAEFHQLKGEAILKRDSSATAEAEASFRQAIEIAKLQSAKWWELRATTSLARLLCDTGRRDEARAMLAEIHNWFTEGFDTADLKDAKALLDELSNST